MCQGHSLWGRPLGLMVINASTMQIIGPTSILIREEDGLGGSSGWWVRTLCCMLYWKTMTDTAVEMFILSLSNSVSNP